MKRRMSEAAKGRWRKRKAAMDVAQNEGEDNIQRESLASQNEVAEGPSHSALTTDNEQTKHSQSAAFTSTRKVSKANNMIVRRSNRIKSFGLFGKRQGRKAVQHIDLIDCDRDKEPHVEPISLKPFRGEDSIQRASLASQNEVAAGPSYSVLTTDNDQSKHSQSAAFTSKRKVSEVNNMIVRRSNRIKSLGLLGKRQGKKAVQHIDLTDCGRDKKLHVEPISLKPIRDMVHTQAGGPKNSALTNAQSKLSQAFSSKRKTLKANNMIVRQSGQLKSSGSIGKRQGRKGVHHVDPTDCDRDKELHVEPISLKPIRGVVQAQADGPKNSALTNAQSKLSQAFPSKRKTLKANNMIVRQSGQLKSLGSIGKRQGRKGVHRVNPTNCDRDKELHVVSISPEPIRNMRSSDMIVDHLVQTRGKRPLASETTPTNLNYKTLYTASEKKIVALTEENHRQAQKLYYMLGKVETYENVIGSVTNLSCAAVELHPYAAALNSARAPKSSPVKKKKTSVKRMKKN